MKKLSLITLLFCAFVLKAQNNLILNGSFELNGAAAFCNDIDDNFEYNNLIQYSASFGDKYTSGIFKLPCLICSPPVLLGVWLKKEVGYYQLEVIIKQ